MKSHREKMERSKFITLLIMLALLVLAKLGDVYDAPAIYYIILLVVVAGCVVYDIKICRCPHCGKSLRNVRGIPDHCPHCGKKIE